MVLDTGKIYNFFWRNVPESAKQKPAKVLFVGKKMWWSFSHMRGKIVIVNRNKWVKNHHFCSIISLF